MSTMSLYTRLGESDGVARLVDTIVDAHMQNSAIKARFEPYRDDPARLETIKGHLRAFISAGTGGPDEYGGRSMPDAHRGMNISESEYMAAVDDIMGALEAHAADEQTRKDMLAIAWSLKNEIVGV